MTAARITPRKTVQSFVETYHLVADCHRMLGAPFNPKWSYARIRYEHDEAAKALVLRKFSKRKFADDWAYSKDGYTARRLISEAEIAFEGVEQRHCVATYAAAAAKGICVIFKIEGKERATVSMTGNQIDQAYGACNSPVTEECMEFIYEVAFKFHGASKILF